MSYFLNNIDKENDFILATKIKYFVDKTELICKLNEKISVLERYVCITRPRRFGKSINAFMLASYYTNNLDTKNIFDKLTVSKCESYEEHLNKHNVIYMSLNAGGGKFKSYKEDTKLLQSPTNSL